MDRPPTPPDSPAIKAQKVHESSSPPQRPRQSSLHWGVALSTSAPLLPTSTTSHSPVVDPARIDLTEDDGADRRQATMTPPASPVSRASQEKLAAGTKQYVTLLNAVREGTLCKTQGGDWKDKKVKSGEPLTYLQGNVF